MTGGLWRGRGRRPTGPGSLSFLASRLLVAVLGGLLCATGLARAQEPRVPTVRDLEVEGNRRVQRSVILNRVATKLGDPFSPGGLREDVRAIFTLGFFDDVQLRVEDFEGGVRVVFVVVERPLLREVGFEGNQEVKTDDLRDKAALRIGVLYNPVEVQRAVEAMRQQFEDEGFFGATILPRTERTPEGDLRVVFRIEEGPKFYVDRIEIGGNQVLSARQIKGAMQTEERLFYVLPFAKVNRKVFEDDAERILDLYQNAGYPQARIEEHVIVPDRERGKITLRTRVSEGPQFRFGPVTIRGNDVVGDAEIRSLIRIQEGEVYNRSLIRGAVRAISERYSAIGRARVEVTPSTDVDVEGRRISVILTIKEGAEVFVERINIVGNTRSSDKVLRRELRLVEGDLFTFQKLVRSRQRLFNLGYFEEVSVTTEPGSEADRVVINVQVKERATGLFSVGAGYSSLDNFFATVEITQRNFLGLGQELFLQARLGSSSRLGRIGFTEPYLFDIPLRAGADIYDQQREYTDFSEERIGGDLRASYPLAEYVTLAGLYKLENVTVSDVAATASEDLKQEEGTKLNSVVEFVLSRDTRDNRFEPTRGSRHALEVGFAGLGGDTRYYRITGDTTWFFPLPVWNLVLGARALAGYVHGWGGEEVPIFERFFLGGSNSLRGQETRSVGPQDAQGNVIGGTSELLGSVELLIPVIANVRLALFFDAGNAYGFGTPFDPLDLRLAAGTEIRYFSPLGPLRLGYGINLDRKTGEDFGQVLFSFGAPF